MIVHILSITFSFTRLWEAHLLYILQSKKWPSPNQFVILELSIFETTFLEQTIFLSQVARRRFFYESKWVAKLRTHTSSRKAQFLETNIGHRVVLYEYFRSESFRQPDLVRESPSNQVLWTDRQLFHWQKFSSLSSSSNSPSSPVVVLLPHPTEILRHASIRCANELL